MELPPGEILDRDVAMQRPVALDLRFVDEGGSGTKAVVGFSPYDPDDPNAAFESFGSFFWESEADGRLAENAQLAPGLWLARVNLERSREDRDGGAGITAAPFVVDLRGGPSPPLTVVLVPTTRLHLAAGEGVEGLRYTLFQEGLPLHYWRFYETSPQVLHVAPGRFLLTLRDEAEVLKELSFSVGAKELRVDVVR